MSALSPYGILCRRWSSSREPRVSRTELARPASLFWYVVDIMCRIVGAGWLLYWGFRMVYEWVT